MAKENDIVYKNVTDDKECRGGNGQKYSPPNVGIEPTTTRLRVVRSTDWANSADACFSATAINKF